MNEVTATDGFESFLDEAQSHITPQDLGSFLKLTHRGRLLEGFNESNGRQLVACPWITYWWSTAKNSRRHPEGIYIMQDWWTADGTNLQKAVSELTDWLDSETVPRPTDRTFRRLLRAEDGSRSELSKAVRDGRWLVTNAVWALRPKAESDRPSSVTGMLPADVHRMGFRIWSKLIELVAKKGRIKIVLAGAWARRPEKRGKPVSTLMDWAEWAGVPDAKRYAELSVELFFQPHPASCQFKREYIKALMKDHRHEAA